MAEPQPDTRLIEWLDFPAPPHAVAGSRSAAVLWLGYLMLVLLFTAGVGVLVGFFGFTASGRGLLVDTALAAGLGQPLPQARIEWGDCSYAGSSPGSRVPGQWRCPATVVAGAERTVVLVETVSRNEELQALGAGRVFGSTGIYWPLGTMAARWWSTLLLVVIGVGLIGLSMTFRTLAAEARRLQRVRRGQVRSADLMTWQGRPWFSFVDDAGVRRFQQPDAVGFPLILDGVRSTSAALVHGHTAVLLLGNLHPLQLDAARRAALLERAGQVQRQCQVRRALPAQPGDPDSLAGRIARIEQALAGKPRKPDAQALERLYDDAWRLVWDSNDAAVAERALAARDSIALRLGPAAAHAALQACRRRHAAA